MNVCFTAESGSRHAIADTLVKGVRQPNQKAYKARCREVQSHISSWEYPNPTLVIKHACHRPHHLCDNPPMLQLDPNDSKELAFALHKVYVNPDSPWLKLLNG